MVRYLNPGGFDFGRENLDGYGISNIVVGVVYSICFYIACIFLWTQRHHPIVKMRNVPLLLASLFCLHVYLFMVMVVYTLNGSFPCQVEFWSMSLYFPLGIGLFQAQNQQLLVVSQGQARLMTSKEHYRPFLPKGGRGIGGPRYWRFRLKLWWNSVNEESRYQGFVLVGCFIQFLVSFIIYNISRKFNHYGVVSKHVGPGQCRRGWEWAPSVIWQFLWNYFFGPYLIWKIRLIRDIYHWRLQTILSIVAGLPGTPLWLAAIYTNSFASVNKYWIPAMWFVPGLMTMEIVTLGFPIYQIFKAKRSARETNRVLAEFDNKRMTSFDGSTASTSLKTLSTSNSKRGRMYSMESLDEALATNDDGLQLYASLTELNGENIIFLTKVLDFNKACQKSLCTTTGSDSDRQRARTAMFRLGLSIFVSLVHSGTASYPINIESPIYNRLDAIFGPATALVAITRKSSVSSSISTPSSATPWDDPVDGDDAGTSVSDENTLAMQSMYSSNRLSNRQSKGAESTEHIMTCVATEDIESGTQGADDPLQGVTVPADFDASVFDAAFKSVRYMVWTETWQRYQGGKSRRNSPAGVASV